MTEINVNLTMDKDGNILIKSGTEKEYTITFDNKIINAQKIYDLLDYKSEYIYKINSNIENVEDAKIKEYFDDVIDLLQKITDDINELNKKENEPQKKEEDMEVNDLLENM